MKSKFQVFRSKNWLP